MFKKVPPRNLYLGCFLIETGMHEADIVILVAMPKEIQIKRLIDRTGFPWKLPEIKQSDEPEEKAIC